MSIDQLIKFSSLPEEGHDAEWLSFIRDCLKMPDCYLLAAQEVLRQRGWRKLTRVGDNPIGYVRTATYRQALNTKMALDRKGEPLVPTKDIPPRPRKRTGSSGAPTWAKTAQRRLLSAGMRPEVELLFGSHGRSEFLLVLREENYETFSSPGATPEESIRGILEASRSGGKAAHFFDVPPALKYRVLDKRRGRVPYAPPSWSLKGDDYTVEDHIDRCSLAEEQASGSALDDLPEIPAWLRAGADGRSVDWGKVAQYSVRNPAMAPEVGRVLELRAKGVGIAGALEMASDEDERRSLIAAWKWIHRNSHAIRRVLIAEEPPTRNPCTRVAPKPPSQMNLRSPRWHLE